MWPGAADAPLATAHELEHHRVVTGRLDHEMAARLEDPVRLAQRLEGIVDMLDHVIEQHDVGGLIRQVGGVEDGVDHLQAQLSLE